MPEQPTIAPLEEAPYKDYFESIYQVPPVVCGRQLKCLSIGRYRLMARFNVAFTAETERMATAGDLLLAVLICSMEVSDFMIFAAQPDFKAQIMKWGRKFGFFPPRLFSWPLVGRWCERMFGESLAEADYAYLNEQIGVFQKFVREGSQAPEYWDENPGGKASASHWSQSVEVVLMGELNWSELSINEQPLTKALSDYFKYMENQGLIRLMSAEEARQSNTPLTPEQIRESEETAKKLLDYLAQQRGMQ